MAAGDVLQVDGLDRGGGPGVRKAGQGHVAVVADGLQHVGAGAVHVQAQVLIGVGDDRLAVGLIDDAHALDVGHQLVEARARTRAGEGQGQVRVVRDGDLHRADQRRAQGRVRAAGERIGHVLRHERVAGVELDAAAERDVHAAVLVLHIGLGQGADDVAVVVQVEQRVIDVDDDVVLDLLHEELRVQGRDLVGQGHGEGILLLAVGGGAGQAGAAGRLLAVGLARIRALVRAGALRGRGGLARAGRLPAGAGRQRAERNDQRQEQRQNGFALVHLVSPFRLD